MKTLNKQLPILKKIILKTKIFLIILPIFLLSGCWCEPKIVIKEKIVNIPVKCKIKTPKCDLNENQTDTEFIGEMYKCNLKYKEVIKICQ